jgi:hypothetical protein
LIPKELPELIHVRSIGAQSPSAPAMAVTFSANVQTADYMNAQNQIKFAI